MLTDQDWHQIFQRFDQDNSGLIDSRELHAALEGFGFSLPADMVRKVEKRFAPPPKAGEDRPAGISFDRFLMACVAVKHYTEAFRRFDPNGTGCAQIDYNAFVSSTPRAQGEQRGFGTGRVKRVRKGTSRTASGAANVASGGCTARSVPKHILVPRSR